MANVNNILNDLINLVSEAVNSLDAESETMSVALHSPSQDSSVNADLHTNDTAESLRQ